MTIDGLIIEIVNTLLWSILSQGLLHTGLTAGYWKFQSVDADLDIDFYELRDHWERKKLIDGHMRIN